MISKLNDLLAQIDEDMVINVEDLEEEAAKTPALYAKYIRHLVTSTVSLNHRDEVYSKRNNLCLRRQWVQHLLFARWNCWRRWLEA